MKKVLCFALAMMLCVSLCGCRAIGSRLGAIPGVGDVFGRLSEQRGNSTEQTNEGVEDAKVENTVTLPHFEGQLIDYASEWLNAEGITVTTEYVYNNEFAEDVVISQSVPAGTKITPDTYLTLIISLGEEQCPYEYAQKLTVTAAIGATQAKATLYEWKNGDWQQLAVYNASVGKNGLGTAQEGSRRTPLGVYDLGVVLSANTVRTNLPVRTVSKSTCVVDDTGSSYYNMIMETHQVPKGTSYDQIGKSLTNGTTYATIYIEHNGDGFSSAGVVPGKGSAIGIRGQYGSLKATYGDVDISYTDMMDLLSRLDVNKNPVIEIVLK